MTSPNRSKSDALVTIPAVYRPAGSKSVNQELDLDRPMTFVHDVAPGALELTSLLVQRTISQTSAGAGPVFRTVVPQNLFGANLTDEALRNLGRTLGNSDVYLIGLGAKGNGTNLDSCTAAISSPGVGRSVGSADTEDDAVVIFHGNTVLGQPFASGSLGGISFTDGASVEHPADWISPLRFPIRLGTLFAAVDDDAVGPATIQWTERYAIVPVGAPPPTYG